jgi:hypothetical protein
MKLNKRKEIINKTKLGKRNEMKKRKRKTEIFKAFALRFVFAS